MLFSANAFLYIMEEININPNLNERCLWAGRRTLSPHMLIGASGLVHEGVSNLRIWNFHEIHGFWERENRMNIRHPHPHRGWAWVWILTYCCCQCNTLQRSFLSVVTLYDVWPVCLPELANRSMFLLTSPFFGQLSGFHVFTLAFHWPLCVVFPILWPPAILSCLAEC